MNGSRLGRIGTVYRISINGEGSDEPVWEVL